MNDREIALQSYRTLSLDALLDMRLNGSCAYSVAEQVIREKIESLENTDPCNWTEDTDGVWQTDCGDAFELNDGTPKANGVKFCFCCGKPVTESLFDEEDV